jgi:hypothetical protein
MQVDETRADIELRMLDALHVAVGHFGGRRKSGKVVTAQNAPASHVPGLQVVVESLSDAVVHEVLQILQMSDLLRPKDLPRVLIVEPLSSSVGDKLKAAGFAGELWALCSPTSPFFFQRQRGSAYDHVVMADWLSAARDNGQCSSLEEIGQFDIVVMLEVARAVPHEQVAAMLRWSAGRLLRPYGYLVSAEPWEAPSQVELETKLLHSELILAADERKIETDWSWSLTRWQMRPGASSQLGGRLSLVTMKDVERDSTVRDTLFSCYLEAFGDGEWGEWMYCVSCERRYSRSEYAALSVQDQCVCGAPRPLVAYHTLEFVLADMRHDLATPENSHLYVRLGAANQVDAYIWGSLSTAEEIAFDLLPRQGSIEQRKLRRILAHQLEKFGISDPSALIYHQESIGVLEAVRNLSLVRALFTRMCQFALDRGSEYVVAATIPTVNSYKLLRSIGMEVIYTYPSTENTIPVLPIELREEIFQGRGRSMLLRSALDDSGVILGGSVRSLLKNMSYQSDRTLVAQTLRYMKQEKTGQSVVVGDESGG